MCMGNGHGLDMPTGRTVSIPSSITCQPVNYFIPAPLSELLARCPSVAGPQELETGKEIEAAALLHLAARRGYIGVRDPVQAGLLFDLLWQPSPIESPADVHALAARIDPRAQDLRRQIVFTGSRVASDAVHVYAPHEAVPELIEQLVEGLQLEASGIHVADRVSVLGFFCVHAHPFRDGNGRWTRALILAAERRALIRTIAAMSFQTLCMQPLAEIIWPLTRTQGLRAYLAACRTYTERLLSVYGNSAAHVSIRGVNEALRRAAPDKPRLRAVARRLFVSGRLEAGETRQMLGASARVVDGLFRALEGHGLTVSQEGVSINRLLAEISEQADASASFALASLKECKG